MPVQLIQGVRKVSLQLLQDAVARRQVIVVAGTGVSAAIGGGASTATWIGLLKDGIDRVEAADPNRAALLRMRLETFEEARPEKRRISDLTNLATELRQEFESEGDGRFGRWLDAALGRLNPSDSTLAADLAALGAPILTTNYDTLLEQSLKRGSASWLQPDAMRRIVTRANSDIGHLHGIYTDPKSVIFTAADYSRILSNSAAQIVQTSAFAMNTFLFVGFGSGMSDPNFKLMIDNFGSAFSGTSGAHYRLCLADDRDEGSSLSSVTDIAYGSTYDDLSQFLRSLAPEPSRGGSVDLRAHSFDEIETRARDNSALWRDAESLEQKTVSELIVPPIFLPEPHDQFATSTVLDGDAKRVEPLSMEAILKKAKIIVVAGEENSGVSTAILWMLHHMISNDPTLHSQFVDNPFGGGPQPISAKLRRMYRVWGINPLDDEVLKSCVLGIDNLRVEASDKFDRTMGDIAKLRTRTTILGVRQQDVLELVNALNERGAADVAVAYLGRFSDGEAQELARRVSPGSEVRLVTAVMVIIREKRLPRNPFTITLLIELIRSGSNLKEQESEIAVLDRYLDLLLIGDFFRDSARDQLTLRNKRVALVAIARRLVEAKEDKAGQAEVIGWIEELFADLGWPYDALSCVEDLVRRRVLSTGPGNTLRFQRSAYLELMAGIAAQEDQEFRRLVFSSPLELASIVRTYAAMTRNDITILDLMEDQLARLGTNSPGGTIFGGIRQLKAPEKLFSDDNSTSSEKDAEADADAGETQLANEVGLYYDNTDDSDVPAFLTARVEDLPPGRVAMLVVDLASRVLRDTDEVRDQERKARVLRKVLEAWVTFIDLAESDLRTHPDLDDVVRSISTEARPLTDDEVASYRSLLLKIAPSYLALSGISYCLAGPSLVPLLRELNLDPSRDTEDYAGMVRILALYASGSSEWVDSLSKLSVRSKKTWYAAAFLSSMARYAYIVDKNLSETQRESIRHFLRESIAVRYVFDGVSARNNAMNAFEAELRRAHLRESRRPGRPITVL